MSENTKQDRRIERTLQALWEALFALLHENVWQEINVSMICRKANVARSSFYLHFQNKQELLDYGFEIGLRDARSEITALKQCDSGFATLYWLAHHIYSVRVTQKSKLIEDAYIFSRFQRTFAGLFAEEMHRRGKAVDDYVLSFVIGGTFSVVQAWASPDTPTPPDQLAAQLDELVAKLL